MVPISVTCPYCQSDPIVKLMFKGFQTTRVELNDDESTRLGLLLPGAPSRFLRRIFRRQTVADTDFPL